MPNHIKNRLQIIGDNTEVQKVLSFIKGKYDDGSEMQIDFNKIIQMPKGMEVEVDSEVKMWTEICTGQIDFSCLFEPPKDTASNMLKNRDYKTLSTRMAAGTAMEYLTGKRTGTVKDLTDDKFGQFIQCLKNYREHGSTSWYEWSIENWGTKWNAYSQNDKRNTEDTIYFETAWSSPFKIFQRLAEIFPAIKFLVAYADEDTGSNTGKLVFENGKLVDLIQPESQSKESYDIYFELNPEDIDNFKLVNGKYEYIEQEID